MGIQVKNNAATTITSDISSVATSVTVASGTGALFPSLGSTDYFYATLVSTSGVSEIVKVTARSGDAMTIVRAQEGSLAIAFSSGSRFELRVTAQNVADIATEAANAVIATTVYTASLGSTDNRVLRTDGTDTRKAQGSFVTIDDSGNIATPGYIDLVEQAVPSAPDVNTARIYAYDDAGTTRIAYKDNAGTASPIGTVDAASAFGTDNRIVRTDGTAKDVQVSAVTLDDSGSVSGVADLTASGVLKVGDGAVGTPSVSFGSDTNTGLYRKAADTIGIAVGGVEVGEISAKGTTLVPPGVMMPYVGTSAPTGWVRANGRTIGSASSGASERANADTASLYALLWDSYADSVCPVSSGRGASAAADYAANKTIGLPDLRGRAFSGLDAMGNTAAGRIGTVLTSPTTNGASGGAETVTLVEANLPSHTHTGTTASGGAHTHDIAYASSLRGTTGTLAVVDTVGGGNGTTQTASGGAHTHTFTTNATGSGTAVANMPPTFLTTFIIKL